MKKYPKKGEYPPKNILIDNEQTSYSVLAFYRLPGMGKIYLASYDYESKKWYYIEIGGSCEVMDFHEDPQWWTGIIDELTGESTDDQDYHKKRMDNKYYTDIDVEKMVDEYFDSLPDVIHHENMVEQNIFKSGALFINHEYRKTNK